MKFLCSHSIEDAAAEEDAEMIYIKCQYGDVTIPYIKKYMLLVPAKQAIIGPMYKSDLQKYGTGGGDSNAEL